MMNQSIVTFNSKHDIYGNRRNLVINQDTKQLYFSGCNAYNLGMVYNDCGIREVNKIYKDYLKDGFKEVKHSEVRDNWRD